jgi:membrane protease YdiL (CAAX protease family)
MKGLASLAGSAGEALRNPYAFLFCILAVSFTLLSSVLHVRRLKQKRAGDFTAVMTYFACFWLLLFALPLTAVLCMAETGVTPAAFGLKAGDWKTGLVVALAAAPLAAVAGFVGSRDPRMREAYPFSKDSMAGIGRFVLYEAAYLLLYYTAWEFAFRGVMLFSLAALLPAGPAGLAMAVLSQTLLSTVYHLGHPDSEVFAAFAAGIILGWIALATGSILYTIAIHAMVGIFQDCFLYRRRPRKAIAESGAE